MLRKREGGNMKTKKVYFDTEFTGLHQGTSLISIGLITEKGKEFYAECNDYNLLECNDWIMDNVIVNLVFKDRYYYKETDKSLNICANKLTIAKRLREWLSNQFSDSDEIQFVSDCSHYDFVLIVDLLTAGVGTSFPSTAFDLPKNVVPVCHDINQDIATHFNISLKEAFDMSREEILIKNQIRVQGKKHNSLYDAKVIKMISENLYRFK